MPTCYAFLTLGPCPGQRQIRARRAAAVRWTAVTFGSRNGCGAWPHALPSPRGFRIRDLRASGSSNECSHTGGCRRPPCRIFHRHVDLRVVRHQSPDLARTLARWSAFSRSARRCRVKAGAEVRGHSHRAVVAAAKDHRKLRRSRTWSRHPGGQHRHGKPMRRSACDRKPGNRSTRGVSHGFDGGGQQDQPAAASGWRVPRPAPTRRT